MKLTEITANIRLRSTWEAIDLGFAMVQSWFKSLYAPLAIVIFSIAIVLYLIVPEGKLWIASLIFWWLKPLYDRVVLYVISNRLFNNQVTTGQTLKAIPSLIWNTGLFQTLTFRRFSFSRGFNLSLWQLEKLRGEDRYKRQQILHDDAHSQAVWLTISMVHLEAFLTFSLFGLVFLFLPESTQSDFISAIFNAKGEYTQWIDVMNYAFYVIVIVFLHPFYIAGSFALYLNRRTQLEAWDIELDFKKLSQRLKESSKQLFSFVLISFIVLTLVTSPKYSIAKEQTVATEEFLSESRLGAEKSKDIINKVMLTKNLDDKEIVNRWVKIKKEDNNKEKTDTSKLEDFFKPFAKAFAFIVEFGLWFMIGLGIVLLVYFRDKWLHLFNIETTKDSDYESPDIMFGMDVRPESLPKDITGKAQQLWQSTQHREALSLLYRGALVRLINHEQVRLKNSHTEGDVLRHSKQLLSKPKQRYLSSLTDQWRLIAYAHKTPSESDMQYLFDHWSSDFSVPEGSRDE